MPTAAARAVLASLGAAAEAALDDEVDDEPAPEPAPEPADEPAPEPADEPARFEIALFTAAPPVVAVESWSCRCRRGPGGDEASKDASGQDGACPGSRQRAPQAPQVPQAPHGP